MLFRSLEQQHIRRHRPLGRVAGSIREFQRRLLERHGHIGTDTTFIKKTLQLPGKITERCKPFVVVDVLIQTRSEERMNSRAFTDVRP